jgi:two-component system, NtrC family, nitrogen regulation sensor histidine kinase NtrY
MKTPDFFNHRSIFLLVAFTFTLILALALSEIVRYKNRPEIIVERLAKEVEISEKQLKVEIDALELKLKNDDKSFNSYLNNHYSDYFRKEGQIFLVYRNRILKYWTDNAFPAPDIYDTTLYTSEAINSGNGWYIAEKKQCGEYIIAGLQLLKYRYKYHNDFLPDSFFGKFPLPENTTISTTPGKGSSKHYKINSPGGKLLCYISFNGIPRPGPWTVPILFMLYSLSLIFLIAFVFALYKAFYKSYKTPWLLLAFYVDVLIIRAIQFYFKFPAILYESDLFSPIFYASSDLLPSLGDLFINVIVALQVAWFTYKGMGSYKIRFTYKPIHQIPVLVLGTLFIGILFHVMNLLIQSLVINSSIPFGFEGLFRISLLTLTGFSIIAGILFSFLFLFYSISKWIYKIGINPKSYLFAGLSVSIVYACYLYIESKFNIYYSLILAAVFITFYLQQQKQRIEPIKLSKTVFFVFILAVLANFSLNLYNKHHELEKRKLMALHLTEYRDSMAEYKFGKVSNDIALDDKLIRELRRVQNNPASEQDIIKYLLNNHFNGYWSKFRLQITLCYSGKKLEIKPDNSIVECCDYFDNLILKNGRQTSVSGLYFFDNALDMMYYTGRIALSTEITGLKLPYFIYVEIISKNNFFAIGYPQLLLDKKVAEPGYLFDYSYAIYNKGELIKSAGNYAYDLHELNKFSKPGNSSNFNFNGFNHQFFPINGSSHLVISHRNLSLAESIAPFSYIFIFLSIFMLFFHLVGSKWPLLKQENLTFGIRLQVVLVGIILASSVVIGTVTILNLVRLNETKNMEIVREKMNSVRYELELLLSDYQQVNPEDGNLLADALDRIANELFIDINLYSNQGELLASSRRQIFDDKLLSTQINPASRFNVMENHKSYYFHNEIIGKYRFLSAYATIRNYNNKVIGIVNLPYFSRQTEQKQELSNFLATFTNTYIILIALAIFLALLISKYITKPLQLIKSKLGNLQLGRSNAKIEWTGNDEIGNLVAEYNRMIDELGQKAELLAQSERENAWRQMARQVAHEIKNPLTPIKLSIQHLMRAWNDRAPDWEQRLNKFSQTLVMQIDTLSEIAEEFSDFAQMPEPAMRRFDIVPLLNHSIGLFGNFSNVNITFNTLADHCYVNADENQMLRVFNNLVKNAVQAIPIGREGNINMKLISSEGNCLITITDDGSGILPEQQAKIFSPNFTTKSAGMGLGLAMVKNIIDISGGRIWFKSIPDKGTSFYVELPLAGN